jgi:N-acetylmuramoyl-L-alanine amidase
VKRRLFFAVLCLILLFTLGGQTFAADTVPTVDESELTDTLIEQETEDVTLPPESEEAAIPPAENETAVTGPDILVDGCSIREQAFAFVYKQITYISLRAIVVAMYPDAQVSWAEDGALVQAEGLTITAKPGCTYLVANGRYLYVPDGIILDNGVTMAPVRVLARALGANVSWDVATGNILITAGNGPILSGDSFYKSDAIYWLSRIINAESGGQPMAGKVGVGTVILNRVASPLFLDTIYDVIFDCRSGSYQFSPVRSGSINKEPNAESVVAAKLCLDGAREAGNSLFFNGVGMTCWASRNRSLVTTIGNHSFYD